MGIVTTVNHTLSYEVSKLGGLMKSLLKEVKKHVVSGILSLLKWLCPQATRAQDVNKLFNTNTVT